jgi:hypothetical protein
VAAAVRPPGAGRCRVALATVAYHSIK